MSGRRTEEPLELPLPLPRWWEEHSEIDEMVADLTRMLAGGSLDRTLASFAAFQETVHTHFDAEETTYFPLVERFSPDEAEAVRAAKRGHDRVRSLMKELRAVLVDGDRPAARNLLVQLLDVLREHEAHEDELIRRLKRPSSGHPLE